MPELAEVVRAFEGTALGGREIRAVPVADTGETGFELDIEGVPPMQAWELARPICADLGLWPFASDYEGENVYHRESFDEVRDGRDQTPRAILARADAMPWPIPDATGIRDATEYFARDWVEVLRLCRNHTVLRLSDGPSEEELLAAFPEPGPFPDDYIAIERMLLNWEEARRPTTGQEPPGQFDDPLLDFIEDWLVMLPTPSPWAVPAYSHFWGAGSDRTEALVRTLRSWHERHGAAIWAKTNVTLNLHVSRPIADIHEALTVAAEHIPFHRSSDSLRGHARSLFRANFWEVYDRP